jgi:hypothetical protein
MLAIAGYLYTPLWISNHANPKLTSPTRTPSLRTRQTGNLPHIQNASSKPVTVVYGRSSGLLASANLITLPPDLCEACDALDSRDLTDLREANDGVRILRCPLIDAPEEMFRLALRGYEGAVRAVSGLPLRDPPLEMGALT